MKEKKTQRVEPRKPRQERALHKVELILEAAMRLLGKGGLPALTTNAVAETAGVSIGTLYQYFAHKEAILDALADREMAALSERVMATLQEPAAMRPEERIVRVIRAVTSSYGGRRPVQRIVLGYSLARGGRKLAPLIERLVDYLAAHGRFAADGRVMATSRAEAFVLTNAFSGVMRGMIMAEDGSLPPQDEIEAALGRLMANLTERRQAAGS
ncbi:MAG: TetR/AcrR family transcriptional regulator [Sphingomonadales bacterium]